MDKEYAREFRAYKAETDAQFKALEDAVKALGEQLATSMTTSSGSSKKSAIDATQADNAS